MNNKISVVTSVTNRRDALRSEQNTSGAHFIAYVDEITDSPVWEQRPACRLFTSARRNSRIHKLLIHQYVDSGYSLWMDANISLRVPAEQLIDEWLGQHDIAMFRHRVRHCLYQEARICGQLQLDDPQVIAAQTAAYRAQGFPEDAGLGEACVILRRHTAAVERFNNAWWSEYSRHSVRDQISLMVAARKASVSLNLITPTRFEHPYFASAPRLPGIETPVQLPREAMDIC